MRGLAFSKTALIRAAILFVASAAIAMLILPRPYTRLHYMLAGTLATASALATLFVAALLRGRPSHVTVTRVAQNEEPPS